MEAGSQPIMLQVHKWPWSFGVPEETRKCRDGVLDIEFTACPVLSCEADTRITVGGRHEQFVRERPRFCTIADMILRELALDYLPQGVAAPLGKRQHNLPATIQASSDKTSALFKIFKGDNQAVDSGTRRGIELESTILAWVNVYGRFRESSAGSSRKAAITGEVPWKDVCGIIEDLKSEEKEPRRSLIVTIAEEMRHSIEAIVLGARRILERERRMLPAGKLNELDHACIHWYVRQPGLTAGEKAAVNQQQLLGIARKETYNTLENRVLKDFLRRCVDQARNYLRDCVGKVESDRSQKVRAFKNLCELLLRLPHLEDVEPIKGGVRPNYVLQNDLRYRKVWALYLRLLRQEDDEDKLWAWQNRTWNEIAALLMHVALFKIGQDDHFPYTVKSLATSSVKIVGEQNAGCFVARGTEPGPWIVHTRNKGVETAVVLELVPVDLMDEHPLTKGLGRLGAWELLAVTPLDRRKKPTVIALWPVHTAGTEKEFRLKDILASAENALSRHDANCNSFERFRLRGLVLCSTLDKNMSLDRRFEPGTHVHTAYLHAQPELWSENINTIELLVEDLLEMTL